MTPAKLPATAVYLKIAESAFQMWAAESNGQPAAPWLGRIVDETYADAMAVGFSGSKDQWAKEVRAAGDRISRRLRQARRSAQSQ